jgi:hypothetical protein
MIDTDSESLAYRQPLDMKSGLARLFLSQAQISRLLGPQEPILMATELTIGMVWDLMEGKPNRSSFMHTT